MKRNNIARLLALCCCVVLVAGLLSSCNTASNTKQSSEDESTNNTQDKISSSNQLFDDDLDITDKFADEYFRNYILRHILHKIDSGSTEAEIGAARIYYKDVKPITSMLVNVAGADDLSGLEYFTYLQDFTCKDIRTGLESIDLSGLMFLKTVRIESINDLVSFNVSGCMSLEEIKYYYNNGIFSHDKATIDASDCISLKKLDCYSNDLTELNLSGCVSLEMLNCGSNKLTSLDISELPNLKELKCSNNKLVTLDVSQNVALESLECQKNKLGVLDVSNNVVLQKLYCWENGLTELDVSNCKILMELRYSQRLKDKVIGISSTCEVIDSYI